MRVARSKRTEILKRLLPYINTGNYVEEDRYIIFGARSVWDMFQDLTDLQNDREDHSLEDAVNNFVSDAMLHASRGQTVGRLSLNQSPDFMSNALRKLSKEQIGEILEASKAFAAAGHQPGAIEPQVSPSPDVRETLDAALAEEMLEKLPNAVDRAVNLDQLHLDGIPNQGVKVYFKEAHRCYIYGFHVACAVLCRAMLASALESICDSAEKISKQARPGESYFELLVKKAKSDGLLLDDRPKCAIDIRDAGNDAVHNHSRFVKRWGNKLDEILLNTRKVLLDLYASHDSV